MFTLHSADRLKKGVPVRTHEMPALFTQVLAVAAVAPRPRSDRDVLGVTVRSQTWAAGPTLNRNLSVCRWYKIFINPEAKMVLAP